MPNWVSNSFYIYGGNPSDVLKFYMELDRVIGGSEDSLFAVATRMGIPSADLERVNCRGSIGEVRLESGYVDDNREVPDKLSSPMKGVMVWAESAWSPCDDVMKLFMDKLVPGHHLKLVYLAEEPGNDIWVNTDTEGVYFKEFAVIEAYGPAGSWNDNFYFNRDDTKEFLKMIQELTDKVYLRIEDVKDSDEQIREEYKKHVCEAYKISEEQFEAEGYYCYIHFFER